MSLRRVKPGILLAPDYLNRHSDRAEQRLDLRSIPLVKLFVLREVSRLPLRTCPLGQVGPEGLSVHRPVRSLLQAGGDVSLEDAGRHGPVNVHVRLDVPEGLRTPWGENHRVEQRNAAEVNPLQKVGPEHDTTAYVMTGNGGLFQSPRFDQLPKQARLSSDGDGLVLFSLRVPEAEE